MRSDASKLSDIAKYECYAVAFWKGIPALQELPTIQCAFITHPSSTNAPITTARLVKKLKSWKVPAGLIQQIYSQSPEQPFHALPSEYPLLVLIPFSLALIAPLAVYQIAFALLMALVAGVIFFVLKRFGSVGTAYAFVLYLVAGCWATALGRYDLVPSALTLFALLCAEREKWKWAFTLLALATLFKFYPLVLIPPFFIAQQIQRRDKWYAWRRLVASGIFVAVCAVGMAVSLLLSVAGTIGPFSYFENRPIQVESFSASMVWLLSSPSRYPLTYAFSFGSRNVFSPLSPTVTLIGTALLFVGLLCTFWLQCRGKISLALAVLLTLLVVILTGKVFSAQYMIWIAPFIAYIGKTNKQWLIGWGSISVITTLIYPYLYERANLPFGQLLPDFYSTVFVRNILLLAFICILFYWTMYNRHEEKIN